MAEEVVDVATIKADMEALTTAANEAATLIGELSDAPGVTQEQLDNLHAALLDVTKTLTDATDAAAGPAGR
jgi:hypothetical protein